MHGYFGYRHSLLMLICMVIWLYGYWVIVVILVVGYYGYLVIGNLY